MEVAEPADEVMQDVRVQYALKDDVDVVPRMFVDSGAASVVHERISSDVVVGVAEDQHKDVIPRGEETADEDMHAQAGSAEEMEK